VARALAYLGLGSNQGDPATFIRKAVVALGELPDTTVRAVSGLYRTAPVGFVDQPDFLNAAVAVETGLEPRELLEAVQGIEAAFARTRDIRWGPRTLVSSWSLSPRSRLTWSCVTGDRCAKLSPTLRVRG
jgi:2-amino-4-hydroxy-6-hydroxymethyldihydropteridine diphosphokinase